MLLAVPFVIFAQDEATDSSDSEVEEIVVVGSQIKGASITDALPVTVLSADDIEALGVGDGDELIEQIVEQGLNFFNEQEQASGGVNASRGDSGAYNLRNMGVGNTLTLLNGRRMVNNAGYQTEFIGGDFVPTVTVNTNLIPTNGLDRLEILRDGASAIYGADAVAGVVNNVLKTDYEGSSLSVRVTGYEHFEATNTDISYKFGTTLNDGATNISLFARYRDRGAISASEDERWYSQDYRRYLPEGSPFNVSAMRNTSTYGWFQLDLSGRGVGQPWHASNDGEVEMADATDPRGGAALCASPGAVLTGFGTCMFDTNLGDNRSNQRGMGDYRGEMERQQLFVFLNHEFDNGIELFNEIGVYKSDSNRDISAGSWKSGMFSIPATYYWFSQLPESIGFPTDKSVGIDGWRPFNLNRQISVDKKSTRFVLGLRGTTKNGWDWETAIVNAGASSVDAAGNRITYEAMYEQFYGAVSTTSAAFNIFDTNWDTNNGDNVLTTIYRKDKSTLDMFDFKVSNNELFDLPAGPVGILIGMERRRESYTDDRDPYLDGTITNQDCCGVTSPTRSHPFTSGVLGSSPTVDVVGDKKVDSVFVEMVIPVTEKLDAQIAARTEDFSDTESTSVGRLALGYVVNDYLKMRASFSTAFRSPNILQINQPYVTRTGTRNDAVQEYRIYKNNGNVRPASGSGFGSDYTISNTLHYRLGNDKLLPEESDNATLGLVVTPTDSLTITVDRWSIEKDNTIGLFGRNNSSVYDLLLRIQQGIGGATTVSEMLAFCEGKNVLNSQFGKYALDGSYVLRDSDPSSSYDDDFFNAGICPAGQQDTVYEPYQNLALRTVEGTDIAIYYDFETAIGDFSITLQSSITDKFEQKPSAQFNAISAAVADGTLPAYTVLEGYGDLKNNENIGTDQKDTLRVNYRRGDWGASLSALRVGELFDNGVKGDNGEIYLIPSMTTANVSVYKKFTLKGNDARLRLMIKNIADERAPLADGWFGFYSDIHRDEGRHFYLDLKMDF
jgi:outer membrane receptor for ferrienterochelin and colicin